LKDARSEAAKEIEELKAQKNQEYQNFVAQVKEHTYLLPWILILEMKYSTLDNQIKVSLRSTKRLTPRLRKSVLLLKRRSRMLSIR
jgi:hypothetical protein